MIRAMGEGIFVCAADGRIILAEPGRRGRCSRTSRRRPTTRSSPRSRTRSTRRRPSATVGGPVELRARGSDERWIELSTYPVAREDGGRPVTASAETIVMLRDVTAARQAQAIRDTFIGVLSHELRTPVTTIYAGSKVLARDGDQLPEETRREIFSDIVVESERLHRLVEDVIAMTRFGEDEGDVGTEPVLVQRILPAVIRSEEARWPGVDVRARHAARACRPRSPIRPTSSRSSATSSRTRRSTAAPGTTVRIAVDADDDEVIVRSPTTGRASRPTRRTGVFELFFRSQGTAAAAAAPASACSSAPA